MFSKFTSMIHHAVEALAPTPPLQQDFIAHWKAVTHYFIDNKEHKVAVDQTVIPQHLEAMLDLLVQEEAAMEGGVSGPCMEYTLQHKILETLYTLARTDCPPGMKQLVLQFFTKLLSRIHQPLLPHVNVHRPVHRLMRVCGEAQASPTENEEIQFLCTVCAKLRADPYLVNFFIESTTRSGTSPPGSPPSGATSADTEGHESLPSFSLVDSLLNLMHSEDARVGVKACEGLMLCSSLPENSAAQCLAKTSRFCTELVNQLCKLYDKLPKEMDPVDILSVEAKWGLDVMTSTEDYHNFKGKRALISFLSWLDFCDQLITIAHQAVGKSLATAIKEQFLESILQPCILQLSESGAVTATTHLIRCIRLISSPELLTEFVYFVIGEERQVELLGEPSPKLRQRLIERCDHLSDEVCLTSLRVFEVLLQKPSEHAVHNLVLRNLLGRSYVDIEALDKLNAENDTDNEKRKKVPTATLR